MREILPAVLVTGISFAVVQFLVSNFVGPELTDILAALVSMGCLAALLRFWRPAQVYRFETEGVAAGPRRVSGGSGPPASADVKADTPGRILRAFSMYVVLTMVILVGQMGNLPFFAGHPVGDVKTALAVPANITADLRCGTPGFKLCLQPWIGPCLLYTSPSPRD